MAWITLLRRPVATLAAASALLLLPGCGGKNSDNSGPSGTGVVTMTVKVNYTRIPLVTNANGVPTGLETNAANFKSMPARGVQVRIWQAKDETNPDGTKTRVWLNNLAQGTDSTGTATISDVPKDTDAFVEVISSLPILGTGAVRVIGDPNGIRSGLPVGERVLYALRKGLDGSAPAGNPTPGAKASANGTVTFDVGLTDKWWLTIPTGAQIANATQESTGTGSRVLAILDTAYAYNNSGLGISSPGRTLDLHYRPGVSDVQGSFIEYDRTKFPLSYDSETSTPFLHYFGSIKGGASNDDAFDEGVLLPMMARNGLWALGLVSTTITGKALPDLSPDVALLEALPYAQAASILKSPYLADTTPASSLNLDIRSLGSFASGPSSGPAMAALAWDVILKANSLPNPGTPTDWAKINNAAAARYFGILSPADLTDRPNAFLQLGRLKEAKTASEPVDLALIFTDAVLTALAAPYNIPWPRPTTGAGSLYVVAWGADPNSLAAPLPPLALSMLKSEAVNGVFPNTSAGEVAYARLTLSKDIAYTLHVTTTPAALPAGTSVEVRFLSSGLAYEFSGTATPGSRIVLRGNKDAPLVYLVRVQLLSPGTRAPDITATVSLDLAN